MNHDLESALETDPQDAYDVPVDEQDPDPEALQVSLSKLSTAVEWLTDLQGTIKRKGVSSFDMKAVHEIRATLSQEEVCFPPTPALEHYPLAAYTDDRSSLNLTTGLEGIAQTIISTVKQWIRKLIDFVRRLHMWYKKTFKGESNFTALLEKYTIVVEALWDGRRKLVNISNSTVAKDVEKDVEKATLEFLSHPEFERNPLQLAVLGDMDYQLQVSDLSRGADRSIPKLDALVNGLVAFVEGTKNTVNVDDSVLTELGLMVDEIDPLTAQVSRKDYVAYHVMRDKSLVIFRLMFPQEMKTVYPFEHLYDAYGRYKDDLSKIRSYEVSGDVDQFSGLLREVTNGLNHLDKLTRFIYLANQRKVHGMYQILKYEKKVFDLYYERAMDNKVTAREGEKLNKVKSDVYSSIKKVINT